jgi:hypothetical protein
VGYERLIRQADQILFEGWDFGAFRGHFVEAEPSWKSSTTPSARRRTPTVNGTLPLQRMI